MVRHALRLVKVPPERNARYGRDMIRFSFLGLLLLAPGLLPSAAQAGESGRTAVMVLYFDNDSGNGEYDSLAKGLADMMITDLSAVSSLRVVEREKLEALLSELKLQRKKYFDPKTAQRIGKGTGAAYAVTGSFTSFDPNIRMDVRMIKIENATIVKSASVTGTKDKFFDLQQQLTAKLIDGLTGVLSPADSGAVNASARKNKVDNLGVLLDYSKGLDANDRGDLDAASKKMREVVGASPDFQLGKDRYRQIMKALFDAKNRRTSLLSRSDQTLLEHAQAAVAKGNAATSERNLSYRIVLGQYHLTKVAHAIDQGRPTADYKDALRAHVDNQMKLFDETKSLSGYPSNLHLGTYSDEDAKLAEEIGIKMPGNPFPFSYDPSEVLREVGKLLMSNDPSIHLVSSMQGRDAACFYQLDPAYPKLVPQVYKQALDYLDKRDDQYKERNTMRVLQEYARALVFLGRPEEGIAKLQGGLERYPKSDEFKYVEDEIRQILDGQIKAFCRKL
ncbi:MAG: hypothetical protein QOI66_3026 [Myxococcales bacterium]|jgi:TolB-like protein|nr:hypothetical protein [Myxococcales bacterium]